MLLQLQKVVLAVAGFLVANQVMASTLKVGEKPPTVVFSGDLGARVDGTAWSTDNIRDRVWLMFYIAPSRRDDNEPLKDALKAANFPEDKLSSVAIINMASTWVPNVILEAALKKNQEKFPKVTYIKDLQKVLVNKWQLNDDSFDVLVFDRAGKVLMHRSGDFTSQQIQETIELIKQNL